MFAQVYVIKRLPKELAFFDYAIPSRMTVGIGDLVRVPFKGSERYGVVRGVVDRSEIEKPREVLQITAKHFLRAFDIARLERIAEVLQQSPNSIFFAAFGRALQTHPLPSFTTSIKPSVQRELVEDVRRYLRELERVKEVTVADSLEAGFVMAKALRTQLKGQLLILAPQERTAELLPKYVEFPGSVAMMHGHTPERVRGAIIRAWSAGTLQTLISTRQGALLPAKQLAGVLVLQAGNEEHINTRRNPRFDAREAVRLLAKDHQAPRVWHDDLPRLEEAKSGLVLPQRSLVECRIVDMAAKEEKNAHAHLSESLLEEVKRALQSQKKVLLCFNRKGVAKRLQCADCGHLPMCGNCGHPPVLRRSDLVCPACNTEMWYPKTCPACGSSKMKLRGLGKANIALNLRKLFPGITVGEIEKGKIDDANARILVVTDYYFSSVALPLAAKEFGLVADLAADLALFADDFRAQEIAARKLMRLRHFASAQGAQCLIQTWMPDIFRAMLDVPAFVESELQLRQKYHLPPYASRFTTTPTQQLMYDGPYGQNNAGTQKSE